jgi:hypothetical protein
MSAHKQDKGIAIREALFQINKQRLEELAHRAIYKKRLLAEDFVIVCINVDDLAWTDLAEHLMPDHDWQQYRDKGETPVARGSVLAEVCEYLAMVVPGIRDALYGNLPNGYVRVVVMDAGGASVYQIQPASEQKCH